MQQSQPSQVERALIFLEGNLLLKRLNNAGMHYKINAVLLQLGVVLTEDSVQTAQRQVQTSKLLCRYCTKCVAIHLV